MSELNDLLSSSSGTCTSANAPQVDKDLILEAIRNLPPAPKNPFVILAKKNGFDLEGGDQMFIHPNDLTEDAKGFLHKNVHVTEYIPDGNIFFAKAGFMFGR